MPLSTALYWHLIHSARESAEPVNTVDLLDLALTRVVIATVAIELTRA